MISFFSVAEKCSMFPLPTCVQFCLVLCPEGRHPSGRARSHACFSYTGAEENDSLDFISPGEEKLKGGNVLNLGIMSKRASQMHTPKLTYSLRSNHGWEPGFSRREDSTVHRVMESTEGDI